MATPVATLNVSIVGNGTSLRLDLKQNEAALRKFGKQAQTTGQRLSTAFSSFVGNLGANLVTQALSGARRALVDLNKAGIEFNRTFTTAVRIQDLDAKQLASLREATLTTSGQFKASAAELNTVIFDLGSAGFSLEEQIAGIRTVASFAQAGDFSSLQEAGKVLIDITGAARLANSELSRIGDVLVEANRIGKGSLLELSDAIKVSGPTGAALGVPIEQLAVLANAFSEAGKRGAEGGTLINRTLLTLAQEQLKSSKAFKALNIDLFNTAGGFRLASDITQQFERALSGVSAETQLTRLQTLGLDKKLAETVLLLVGTSDKMLEWEAAIESAGGKMDEIADKAITDMDKALNELGESWTRLGTHIEPITTDLVLFTKGLIDATIAINNFVAKSPELQPILTGDISKETRDRLRKEQREAGVELFSGIFPQELPGLGQEFAKRAAAEIAKVKKEIKDAELKVKIDDEALAKAKQGLEEIDLEEIDKELISLADRFKESLATPDEKLRSEIQEILSVDKLLGADFQARALDRAAQRYVDGQLSLIKTADDIVRTQKQSFVEGTQRGSIGDLANRIAGLDAAIGQPPKANPEDIEKIKLLKSVVGIMQVIIDEIKKDDDDVIIRLAQVGLP